jgi:hypothetical protein
MRKEKPILNDNLYSIDDIYLNLFDLIDTNLHFFLNFKKEAEIEKKSFGEMIKDELISEPDISDSLDSFLNFELPNSEYEFHFKYEAKVTEKKERTDIGVISKKYSKHHIICFIEAKRLPTDQVGSLREKEYVLNGIERFKTNKHGNKLPFSLMVGYIQQENATHWHTKVNEWITEQIQISSNQSISWINEDMLSKDITFKSDDTITKYVSEHLKSNSEKIKLYHYWIDLVS